MATGYEDPYEAHGGSQKATSSSGAGLPPEWYAKLFHLLIGFGKKGGFKGISGILGGLQGGGQPVQNQVQVPQVPPYQPLPSQQVDWQALLDALYGQRGGY